MAKGSAAKSAPTMQEATRKPAVKIDYQLPEGFEQVNTDLIGFWDQESILRFRPETMTLIDSDQDDEKASILIKGVLLADALLIKGAREDYEPIEGKAGDPVGVWARPGLIALSKCAGCEVILVPDGEKDTGKKDPMKCFQVNVRGGRAAAKKHLEIEDDFRVKSLKAKVGKWLPRDYDPRNPQRSGRVRPEGLSDTMGGTGDDDDGEEIF